MARAGDGTVTGVAPWRFLWWGTKFAAIVLLTAAAMLLLLDWVLFDTPAVARHLRVADDGLPRDKLLLVPRYRDARVLYLGDSRILTGVDPAVVSEACGCGPGFNGAFAAAEPRLTAIMADQLLRKLSPELVVIGVSQWELSDGAEIRFLRPALDLVPPWRLDELDLALDPADQVEATVGAVWRLYRYRGEVRATLDPSMAPDRPADLRRGFNDYDGPRRLRERDQDQREEQWFDDFAVDGRRAEALRALLADLRGRDIRVVLVAPPLHPAFHARVRSEVETFRTAAERLAAESDALFLDLTEPRRLGLDGDDFQDVVHLDEDGAVELSRYLGREIRSRLADAGPTRSVGVAGIARTSAVRP